MRPIGVLAFSATAVCLINVGGCQPAHQPPSSEPAMTSTMPVKHDAIEGEAKSFTASRGNFSTSLPDGWKQLEKGGDYVLAVTPKDSAGGDGDPVVAVQYPNLPPHIPGLLPLGGVADGYVNDMKKRFPDEKVDQREDAKLDGANARQIVSSFQKDGNPFREIAMLSVHGDHVYVISATSPSGAFDRSQTAFNQITSKWKWTS